MTDGEEEDEDESAIFSEDMIRNPEVVAELIATEYSEAGEEARYRDNLLNNSYYLSILVYGIFLNSYLSLISNNTPRIAIVVTIMAGLFSTFITLIIYLYSIDRNSAWLRRKQIENQLTEYDVPLNIQESVVESQLKVGDEGIVTSDSAVDQILNTGDSAYKNNFFAVLLGFLSITFWAVAFIYTLIIII